MELKHHFTVPSSLEDTWHSFNQLEEIAPCFPGATLTTVDGDSFTGTVKIKLGPIAMLYAGTGEFISRDEDTHTVVIRASGKDKRGNGTAGATVTAVLATSGQGTTVDVTTDMNVTGKPAQFGRGVIQDISDKLLETFVQCVIRKASPEADDSTAVGEDFPGPASTQAVSSNGAGQVSAGASATTVAAPAGQAAKHLAPPVEPAPELDLGSAVLPVLAKRFGPAVLAAVALVSAVVYLVRMRRKRKCGGS